MGALDNLNSSTVQDIFRRLRALETAPAATNTAIGRAGMEVYDGGVITISNGGLDVTGTIEVTGTLQADGIIAFTGTLTQSGPSTFTGTTNLNGPTNIAGNVTATGTFTNNGPTNLNGATKTTGTLSVEGATTLKNNLSVTGGGKITAGGVTIDPSVYSGSVSFSNGTYLAATPNGAQLVQGGGGAVTVSAGQADVSVAGGGGVIADLSGVSIQGLPTTSSPANLRIDPSSNRLYRVV